MNCKAARGRARGHSSPGGTRFWGTSRDWPYARRRTALSTAMKTSCFGPVPGVAPNSRSNAVLNLITATGSSGGYVTYAPHSHRRPSISRLSAYSPGAGLPILNSRTSASTRRSYRQQGTTDLTPNLTPSSPDHHGPRPTVTDYVASQINSDNTNQTVRNSGTRLWHSDGSSTAHFLCRSSVNCPWEKLPPPLVATAISSSGMLLTREAPSSTWSV